MHTALKLTICYLLVSLARTESAAERGGTTNPNTGTIGIPTNTCVATNGPVAESMALGASKAELSLRTLNTTLSESEICGFFANYPNEKYSKAPAILAVGELICRFGWYVLDAHYQDADRFPELARFVAYSRSRRTIVQRISELLNQIGYGPGRKMTYGGLLNNYGLGKMEITFSERIKEEVTQWGLKVTSTSTTIEFAPETVSHEVPVSGPYTYMTSSYYNVCLKTTSDRKTIKQTVALWKKVPSYVGAGATTNYVSEVILSFPTEKAAKDFASCMSNLAQLGPCPEIANIATSGK